jgi:uncharacterized protein (DUF4415 family)
VTDWRKLASLSDASIRRAAKADQDTFVPDKAWWDKATVVVPGAKKLVSLRIDEDVLDWFRRQGRGYQTRINAILRSYMDARSGRTPS